MGKRVVRRHVGQLKNQDEARPGGNAIALLDRGPCERARFEVVERFGRSYIQRDFHDRSQPGPKFARFQDSDLTRNKTRGSKAAHSTEASGRRGMYSLGQLLVCERAVVLKHIEDPEVQVVERVSRDV